MLSACKWTFADILLSNSYFPVLFSLYLLDVFPVCYRPSSNLLSFIAVPTTFAVLYLSFRLCIFLLFFCSISHSTDFSMLSLAHQTNFRNCPHSMWMNSEKPHTHIQCVWAAFFKKLFVVCNVSLSFSLLFLCWKNGRIKYLFPLFCLIFNFVHSFFFPIFVLFASFTSCFVVVVRLILQNHLSHLKIGCCYLFCTCEIRKCHFDAFPIRRWFS